MTHSNQSSPLVKNIFSRDFKRSKNEVKKDDLSRGVSSLV